MLFISAAAAAAVVAAAGGGEDGMSDGRASKVTATGMSPPPGDESDRDECDVTETVSLPSLLLLSLLSLLLFLVWYPGATGGGGGRTSKLARLRARPCRISLSVSCIPVVTGISGVLAASDTTTCRWDNSIVAGLQPISCCLQIFSMYKLTVAFVGGWSARLLTIRWFKIPPSLVMALLLKDRPYFFRNWRRTLVISVMLNRGAA